jgi:hypothetical protein
MADEPAFEQVTLSPTGLRILKRALTVAELRDELEDQPDDALVLFVCNYGDIGNTQQVLPVTLAEAMYEDQEKIVTTPYSQSGIAVEPTREDEQFDGPDIILLR